MPRDESGYRVGQRATVTGLVRQVTILRDGPIRVTLELHPELEDRRVLAHTLTDCWCGMPHRAEDFG